MFLTIFTILLFQIQTEFNKFDLPFDIIGDQLNFYDDELNIVEQFSFENPEEILLSEMYCIAKNQELYFFGGKSGDVYSIQENEVTRLDKTPDHRLNLNSNIFSHNDTLFKYGGYGYWSQRNFIIYFDLPSKEWQVYKSSIGSYLPKGSYKGLHFKTNEGIYFFGGNSVDESNRLKHKINKELIYFDFQTKEFLLLGKTLIDFDKNNYLIKDDTFIYLIKDAKLYQIDPRNNLINTYSLPNRLWNASKDTKFNTNIKDKYFIKIFDDENKKDPLTIITKDELFVKLDQSTVFFKKDFNYNTLILVLFVFISLIFLYLILKDYKLKKSILLSSVGIQFKKIIYPLKPKEIEIIRTLVLRKEISTQEIISIIENKNLTYVHNTRLKNKTVDELNVKLKTIFNIENLPIIQLSSIKDKRIKVFKIEQYSIKLFDRIQLV